MRPPSPLCERLPPRWPDDTSSIELRLASLASPWRARSLLTVRAAIKSYRQERDLIRQNEELRRLNAELEDIVQARTLERDRIWNVSMDLLLVADVDAQARIVSENSGAALTFTDPSQPDAVAITLANLDRFLAEPAHGGIAQGTVHVAGLTPPEGAKVESGVFNLFVDTDSFYERRMIYLLPFIGKDGQPYLLDGYKEVKDRGDFDVWGATATLYTVIRRGQDKNGPVVSSGIIRLNKKDFAEQLTTFGADELRWIDSMSEIAFVTMDLADHSLPALAAVFLNRYLEHNGDYAGLAAELDA